MSVFRYRYWLALTLVGSFVAAAKAQPEDGHFVTVQNPINDQQVIRIKGEVDAARNEGRNVKKIVFDFNPEGKEAATTTYGACYELAEYILSLRRNNLTTIAFVNGKTTRHTVLPVLACDDLVMSSNGKLGEVASKETVRKAERDYYEELAGISRAGAVLKMMDPTVKLVQVRYKDSFIFVDIRKLDKKNPDPAYADVRPGDLTPVLMGAGLELYDVSGATKFLGCKLQVETRAEIRERYGMSSESERGDPLRGKAVKPVLVKIEGLIDMPLREKVNRQITLAKARKENTFVFVIETTSGGDPAAAASLAEAIVALGKDEANPARTIAFIPGNAPDLAIFPALACQQIVMFKGGIAQEEAVVGDFTALLNLLKGPNGKRINDEFIRRQLEALAEQMGHSKLVIEGLLDDKIAIIQARNDKTGEQQLLNEVDVKGDWKAGKTIKHKGKLLYLNASLAKDLRIARTIDNKDVNEVFALYGIDPKGVRSSTPSALDDFASFLRRTPVSILLVIIGIAGLVLELKAPGLILPGIVAAICFVLFFWAQTQLGGQLIYLAIMLFLLGLALLGVEIFLLPGFGVAGVSGILLILAGLVLAGLDKAPESAGDWADLVGKMLRYGLTMAGAGVLAFILSRYLPNIPYANRLMLTPPEDRVHVEEDALPGTGTAISLLGQVGTTTSMLRPSGLAQFGDRYIDVVTEGDFIPPGTPVQVIEVEGTRIVVKRI